MFSSEEISQTAETLEKLPRTFDRRSASNMRRQQILQQKQTDALPSLSSESPSAKWMWRQIVQLRAENRRLRTSLDASQTEIQQMYIKKSMAQSGLESDLAIVHSDQQQEIAHYQTHLRELMNEHNRLQDEYTAFIQTHQEVLQRFDTLVSEETQKRLQGLSETHRATIVPDGLPDPLQTFVRATEVKAKADGERFLAEVLRLKREVERITEILQHEQHQLEEERQQLMVFQHSLSEQSILRQKTLNERLRLRWQATSVLTSAGLLALLIILQFAFLAFFHVALRTPITIAILAPVIVCMILALISASPPFQFFKHMSLHVPRKKKIG